MVGAGLTARRRGLFAAIVLGALAARAEVRDAGVRLPVPVPAGPGRSAGRSFAATAPEADAGPGLGPGGALPGPAAPSDAGIAVPVGPTLEQQLAALSALNAGQLPDRLTTAELFLVDLRDEAAVSRRRIELTTALGRDGGRGPGDAGRAAAPSSVLERQVLETRLAFLSRPQAERTAMLDAEARAVASAVAREAAALEQANALEERAAAEAAQQQALEAAAQAEEAERRALATERARLESVRIELADAREHLAARRTQVLTGAEGLSAKARDFKARAAAVGPRSPEANALYDELVATLVSARQSLRVALDALGAVTEHPRVELSTLAAAGDPDLEEDRQVLRELVATINAQAAALERDERLLDFDATASSAEHVAALNDVRLSLLPVLTRERRDELLGLGPAGREQFLRELDQLSVSAAWRRRAEGPIIVRWLKGLADPFALAELIVRVLAFVALVLVARFLSGRLPGWLRLSRTLVVRQVRQPVLARWLLTVLDGVASIAPELVLLAVVLLVGGLAEPVLDRPFLLVPYAIAVDYAIYRLVIRAVHRLIGWLAWTPLGALSEEKSARVLRSVRLVGRYAFGLHVFLVVSETILGRGYLYSVASRFGWLGALPLAWVLMRWWKQDIGDAYLRLQPVGTLAGLVRRSRDKSYGFLVGAVALFFVFLAWVGRAARGFVLRFDQTRKALAYVFRKRLERRAGERGEGQEEVAPPTIPPEVLELFRPTPVDGEGFVIDRFPELDDFGEALAEWREREDLLGAWLIVGRTGFGKTSWLNAAAARVQGLPIVRIDLAERHVHAQALVATLASALGVEARTPPELAAALARGPGRLVLLDELQNLMLRGMGGLEPWDALTEVMRQAGPRVFWLGTIAYQPFQYLEWARRGVGSFRHVVRLKRWSEQEINHLLEARTAASGWQVSYQDLLVAQDVGRSDGAHVVQTAQEFTRLIWDYAEGSPRVALDCWARSLSYDGPKRLKVRLFTRPRDAVLEGLDESGRFALGAVAWHENVTADEAATSLGLPLARCHDGLRRLAEAGVVSEATTGRYRVTVPWWPVVNRYLIRKHLIQG